MFKMSIALLMMSLGACGAANNNASVVKSEEAVRGQPTAVTFWFEASVLEVIEQKQLRADLPIWSLKVKLDRRIPNDNGYLYATINGKFYGDEDFHVSINPAVVAAQPHDLKDEQKTDEIIVRFNLNTLGLKSVDEVIAGLGGQKVLVRLVNKY
ncbi:MAG: hypothetical protein NTV34_11675 [Proteobacteria bacterium]|nr:hypothetical protein [Pseudomonadota bacterium]